ncbi:MAG TPA: 16S rRNA (cytosine(1402)-N(4))-methyltransferase RsmH [Chloroflexota bacterium]
MARLSLHVPVLYEEVLYWLRPSPDGAYIDCTVDGGGHASGILGRSSPNGRLLGIDADPDALVVARQRLSPYGHRVTLVQANFRDLAKIAPTHGFSTVQGVLFDLGLSTLQLESFGRGFSFQREEPLDMRFDPLRGPTAAEIVNNASLEELTHLLRTYGEEPRAARIARAIVERRRKRPLQTTTDLVEAVLAAVGPARGRVHPATRTFQALRIAVNEELEALPVALEAAVSLLAPAGRLVVISFHSLEDRVVKWFFRAMSGYHAQPPAGLGIAGAAREPALHVLTPKPVTPSPEEVAANPRARSAKLRVAERLPAGAGHSPRRQP